MLNRRRFVKLTAASALFSNSVLKAFPEAVIPIIDERETVRASAKSYFWEWSPKTDQFKLSDSHGRLITQGSLQPAVLVKPAGGEQYFILGKFASKEIQGNRLSITYEGVNRHSSLTVSWRFDMENLWLEPIVYTAQSTDDVVSLHYFVLLGRSAPEPSLQQAFLIQPGINESSAVSPIMSVTSNINLTGWLGHGDAAGQAWGLPSHFFCGVSTGPALKAKGSFKELRSDAYCCGLAELPAADLFLDVRDGSRCSPIFNIRSDIWGHMRGPKRMVLGSTFCWAIGKDYRDAIRQYYLSLVRIGSIRKKVNSPAKNAIVTGSAFDTWTAQIADGKAWGRYDQDFLESTYHELHACGLTPKTIILDAKWEGNYGLLEHAEDRFPRFEEFLETMRRDGHSLGIWAAFIRCNDPEKMGLNVSHMLHGPEGKPVTFNEEDRTYYLFDFTQSEVQQVLRDRVKRFVERYKPDMVKFDFGYELPSLNAGAPKNMEFAGERLLKYGVDLIVKAMREVNPDIVLMYYSLSPLFIDCIDLHSPDDLYLCPEEYQIEANRRFFFSGLLGEIGMPTFSSTGYDWPSTGDIWFDASPIGSIASMNAFLGDEQDATASPARVAKFNGLSQITRPTNVFTVETLDPVLLGSTSGAHCSSWARFEDGELMLVALRVNEFVGNPGVTACKGAVALTASAVVASKSSLGISRTTHLGIVPYGNGEVSIAHAGKADKAILITHFFGKPSHQETIVVQAGIARVPIYESTQDGKVVEWFEVLFT